MAGCACRALHGLGALHSWVCIAGIAQMDVCRALRGWVCTLSIAQMHTQGATLHGWMCTPIIAHLGMHCPAGYACRTRHSWVSIQKHCTAGRYHNPQRGGGGRHEGSDFLQSLMVREQCGLMGAAESPSGSALEGTEFNVSVQGVPKGERSVRLETLSKRTADHQPGFNEPPQPPPPSSACPKTEPHRLSPSLCRWIFKGFSIVKGLLWE